MLPVLIILAVAFHYLGEERFLTGQNLSIVAQQAAVNTVLGAGMTFVILTIKRWRVQNKAASQSVIGIVPAFTDTGTFLLDYTLGAHFFGGVRRISMPLSIAGDARSRTYKLPLTSRASKLG